MNDLDETLGECIRRSVFIPTTLFEDSAGDIWIGTIGNGLIRYVPSEKRMYPVPGTSCLDISAVEEDADGGCGSVRSGG